MLRKLVATTISLPTMSDPTARELITDLLAALKSWSPAGGGPLEGAEEQCEAALMARAEAFLTEPEPQGQVLARVQFADNEFNCPSDAVLRQYCDDWFYGDPQRSEVDPVDLCRGAIKLFARPAIEPVPIAERLPGSEDCDAEGRCWWSAPETNTKCAVWCLGLKYPPSMFGAISWLPHYALPVPTP